MKATELRMNDWVLVDGEPMKIAETNLTYFSAWKKDGTFCGKIGYEAAEPIALTEEILEKNDWAVDSFCEDCAAWFWVNNCQLELYIDKSSKEDGWAVFVYGDENELVGYSLRNIKYVHELQHLLWALGVEKEVEV